MPISEQLGLAFGDLNNPLPTPAAAPPRRPGRPRKAAAPGLAPSVDGAVPGATPLAALPQAPAPLVIADLEGMARTLETSPDYRVLRRLVPTRCFDRQPQGPLCHLLVLDTETTGLEAGRDAVIELALLRVAVDMATGLPVGEVVVYDGLEDPQRPIPAAITGITGITDGMVRGQRLDEDRIAALLHGVDLVVAHNAGFDRPFVEARLPAFGQLAWACSLNDIDWKALGQGSARLESLALACGLFYSAHRAETDCHALLSVLARPLASWGAAAAGPSPDPATQPTGLATLLTAGQQVHHRLQATGAPFDAKDLLKARGYRWDAPQRVWGTTLRSDEALQDELAWLAQAVYGGQPTRVRVAAVDARQRYSARVVASALVLVEPAFGLGG